MSTEPCQRSIMSNDKIGRAPRGQRGGYRRWDWAHNPEAHKHTKHSELRGSSFRPGPRCYPGMFRHLKSEVTGLLYFTIKGFFRGLPWGVMNLSTCWPVSSWGSVYSSAGSRTNGLRSRTRMVLGSMERSQPRRPMFEVTKAVQTGALVYQMIRKELHRVAD